MPTTIAVKGLGTLLKVGDGGSPTETFSAIAEVKSISGPNFSVDTIDVTHMDSPSGYREFIGSFKDSGEITFDVSWVPDNASHVSLKTDMDALTVRNFQILFTDTSGTTYTFGALITGISITAAIEDMLAGSITLKISGAVTVA